MSDCDKAASEHEICDEMAWNFYLKWAYQDIIWTFKLKLKFYFSIIINKKS